MRKLHAQKILWQFFFKWTEKQEDADKMHLLHSIPFFRELSPWQIKSVYSIIHERQYQADEYVFEIGQPGAALFLIQSGRVSVEIPGHKPTQLAVLDAGQFFGELALLDQSPRSASARALEPTKVLALYRSDLHNLINIEPEIACRIYKQLASIVGDRLKSTNELLKAEARAA